MSHPAPTLAIALIAMGLVPSALAQSPRDHSKRRVQAGARAPEFLVEDLSARRTRAWLDRSNERDKRGFAPDNVGGYELTHRVIVKSPGANPLSLTRGIGRSATRINGLTDYWLIETHNVGQGIELARQLIDNPAIESVSLDIARPIALRALPTDPNFALQWHLRNTLVPGADVNAEVAWALGYTGAGVTIGVVDTSIQTTHVDLAANFNFEATRPFGGGIASSHGTSVAGIAVAVADNGAFGAGIAHGARFSSQVLGGDSDNAAGLAYRNDLNDIKNNSWGPIDNGLADNPAAVIIDAIEQGVRDGRGGLGEIFVWAAGNGRSADDRVEYDPYASSRYTIAVGAVGDLDADTSYSEPGSALMLVAASSGNDRGIYTTSTNGGATSSFGMTSAASPLAAGAVALVLEANPTLHWRDVHEIMIDSARKCDPGNQAWDTNGAGRNIHYSYGFGAVDAGAAVALAETWQRLPHEIELRTGVIDVSSAIPDDVFAGVSDTATITGELVVETVELIVNIDSTYIGDLFIDIVSPDGTTSTLAKKRSDSQHDYTNYKFTSLRHRGEMSAGPWTVRVADRESGDNATWNDYELVIHARPACPLDLDGDGLYGLGDLQGMLTAFGACEDDLAFNPAADINNDGCTNISDLGEYLARFGQACD
jgi:subtilisin-like proprotein convertase family protein